MKSQNVTGKETSWKGKLCSNQ